MFLSPAEIRHVFIQVHPVTFLARSRRSLTSLIVRTETDGLHRSEDDRGTFIKKLKMIVKPVEDSIKS